MSSAHSAAPRSCFGNDEYATYRSKRKSQDISDKTAPEGFFLSAAPPSPLSESHKRFKKTKSFKSFHDLTSENVSENKSSEQEKIIVTPNNEMFMSGFGVKPPRAAPCVPPPVSDDGSACSSRRNSACASSDNLLAFEKGGWSGSGVNVSPKAAQPMPISAPPSMPTSPSAATATATATAKPSKSGWGWFINMDLPGITFRQLSTSRRTVSLNSLNETPLAFIKEQKEEKMLEQNETEEDKTVKWAKAADVVDELFGDLDMPEF